MRRTDHPPAGTIRDWLDFRATRSGDRLAYLFTDCRSSLTWRELRDEARSLAASLTASGVGKGDSVAILAPNGRFSLTAFFGCVYGGFRATMINLVAGDRAIGYALAHCEAQYALVGSGQIAMYERLRTDRQQRIELPATKQAETTHGPASSDDALLMYTSGTTGNPKGVLHSHASLLAGGWTTALAHRLTSNDRGLCVLPIYHINGLCVTVMGTLVAGGSLLMAPSFSASTFWHDIEEHSVTWFSAVPTIFSYLLHADGKPGPETRARLRFARSASAPLPPATQSAFERRFGIPVIETMGITETAAQILSNPLPPATRKEGSSGMAFGNEVAIDPSGTCRISSEGEGEIIVKGPNVMSGYFRDREATTGAFTPEGWYRSGDIGRMDEEGYVFVTGRLKELIIKGGENIAPREIDEILYAHPDVVEAAAFSVPCDTYGERVEAAVALRAGATVTPSILLSRCRQELGSFKAPDRVHILDRLPKGPSGKIQRLGLSRAAAAGSMGEIAGSA